MDSESRTHQTANLNKEKAIKFVYEKHAIIVREEMEKLLLTNKELKESINTRIGNVILSPYRLVKKIIS